MNEPNFDYYKIKIKCPHCQHINWKALGDLKVNASIQCSICNNSYSLNEDSEAENEYLNFVDLEGHAYKPK